MSIFRRTGTFARFSHKLSHRLLLLGSPIGGRQHLALNACAGLTPTPHSDVLADIANSIGHRSVRRIQPRPHLVIHRQVDRLAGTLAAAQRAKCRPCRAAIQAASPAVHPTRPQYLRRKPQGYRRRACGGLCITRAPHPREGQLANDMREPLQTGHRQQSTLATTDGRAGGLREGRWPRRVVL